MKLPYSLFSKILLVPYGFAILCLLTVPQGMAQSAEETGAPVLIQDSAFPANLEMEVRLGPSGAVLPLHSDKPLVLSLEKGGTYEAKAENLEIHGEIVPGTEGRLSEWKVDFRNTGTKQLWLEPRLQWRVSQWDADAQYWNGSYTAKPVEELSDVERFDTIRRMTPLSAFMHHGQAIMVGLHPKDLRSYVASLWERNKEGNRYADVGFATRLVIEPDQTVTVRFLFGSFPVVYGFEREVIQRVHDTAPEAFSPDPKAHPSLYGASAQYWVTRLEAKKIPASAVLELMRRYHATWDWDYAPFKRTGDLWGHEELWDYQPDIPFEKKIRGVIQQNLDFSKVDRSTFLALREQHFNHNRGRDGLYFFTPGGVWVEKSLALEKYADALTVDENYRCELTQWVTGYDREVKVLPWFTSYEKVLKSDWKRIVENYDICGVALDVCRGGPRYRGPSIEKPIPYRAWDEKGVFIDQGVGIAKYIDFLHTLHPRQSPEHVLAVYGNPEVSGATYMTAARYDGGMYEGPPYHPSNASLPLQRYLLGKKPLTWWGGWLYDRYAVPNYKNFDKAHFIRTMQGLADYVIFRSFELAGIPTLNYQHGVPEMMAILPDLLDAVRLGWQAVIPLRYTWEGQLHVARYGTGLETLLFYGNPYESEKPFKVEIDHARLGMRDGEYLIFAPWRIGKAENPLPKGTEALENRILQDGKTQVEFPMLSREPILHRAVAAVEHPPVGMRATARVQRDIYGVHVEIEAIHMGKEPVRWVLPEIGGYQLTQVQMQGQSVSWTPADGRNTLDAATPVGEGGEMKLEIAYQPIWLHLTREEVQSFSLLDEKGLPTFDIVIDGGAGGKASLDMAAEKLRQYVAFYAAVHFDRPSTEVAVYRQEEAPKAKFGRIHLKVSPETEGVGVRLEAPRQILVQGRSAEEIEEVLETLLTAFDAFYPYTPGFVATWGMGHGVLEHTGMAGKVLPERTKDSMSGFSSH